MTGWMGEAPETGAPALPVTAQLVRNRERGPGDTLAVALGRSAGAEARQERDEAAGARDPDEVAAAMINRGYSPGLLTDLVQRCRAAEDELAAEREKIERGERVTARVRGMLERGQVGGLEAARMLDGDFGDPARAEQLDRKAGRLRGELAAAQAMISPQQGRELDPVEAAGRSAHREFVAATRAKFAAAQRGASVPRGRRPFASAGGGDAVRSEPVTCPDCLAIGATPDQSYLIHADPDAPPGVALPTAQAVETGRSSWSHGGTAEAWPVAFDASGREMAYR